VCIVDSDYIFLPPEALKRRYNIIEISFMLGTATIDGLFFAM
jgi:hypothetical protein